MRKFGKKFEEALEAKGIAPATLARERGVQPQRITHWKNRGVAAKYAARVGEILGVEPSLIAGIVTLNLSGKTQKPTRPDIDPRMLETLDLFGELDRDEFVAVVIRMLPKLDKAMRIAIAQAALLDLPASGGP